MRTKYLLLLSLICFATPALSQKVGESSEGYVTKASHFAIGLGGSFGMGMESESDESGMAMGFFVEPSYTMVLDLWSIAEFSLEVGAGKIGFDMDIGDVDLIFNWMALIQAGYGYQLGTGMFAIWKVGVGPASASMEVEGDEVGDEETGFVMRGSAGLRMLASEAVDFTLGLRVTYVTFKFADDVKLTIPDVYLAARIKI